MNNTDQGRKWKRPQSLKPSGVFFSSMRETSCFLFGMQSMMAPSPIFFSLQTQALKTLIIIWVLDGFGEVWAWENENCFSEWQNRYWFYCRWVGSTGRVTLCVCLGVLLHRAYFEMLPLIRKKYLVKGRWVLCRVMVGKASLMWLLMLWQWYDPWGTS